MRSVAARKDEPAPISNGKVSPRTVVEAIDAMLASGQLAPGQRLVEAHFTQQMNTSRSVVREALRYLAGEGVVEIIPNRGARIREIEPAQLSNMLDVFAAVLRAAMEKLIAKGITEKDKASIVKCLDHIKEAASRKSRYDLIKAVYDYHIEICHLSDNPFFIEVLDKLHVHHYNRQGSFQKYIPEQNPALTYSDITALLFEGDADGAYKVWRRQIENVARHLGSQAR